MNDSKNHESNELSSTDADWVAFQYFTGELTNQAAIRFEASLATDQSAREALARAVELTQAIAIVESATVASAPLASANCEVVENCEAVANAAAGGSSMRTHTTWMAPAAWLAVAALACVAFVAFWNPQTLSSRAYPVRQSVTTTDVPASESGELASLWVNTAELLASMGLVGDPESIDGLLDDELLEPANVAAADIGGEADVDRLVAPSWMIAALADGTAVEIQE